MSEGIGGPELLHRGGGGLRQASVRWRRWLHEEIDSAARAGLPPPMTSTYEAGGSRTWILPPSLLSEHDRSFHPSGATSRGGAGPPSQWAHRQGQSDGDPSKPALAGEVVVVRGSGSPIGRQAALSSAEHGATVLLVDPAPKPPSSSAMSSAEEETRRTWAEQAELRQAQAARAAGQQLVHEVRTRYAHTGADAVYVQLATPVVREGAGGQYGVAPPPVGLGERAAAWNCSVERLQL